MIIYSFAAKTPTSKTPTCQADRFIPNRASSQFELAHHLLTKSSEEDDGAFSTQQMRRTLQDNIQGAEASNTRILSYQQKAPAAPEGIAPFKHDFILLTLSLFRLPKQC
jgi:cell division cycle protein 20 (cofactor of APC complex)